MPRLGPLFALALLTACQDGRITLALTDAPVDAASAVVIQVEGVELERDDGSHERFRFDPPRQIDVLSLEGGRREPLLDDAPVPAEDYRSLRLLVSANGDGTDSWIDIDGQRHALRLDPVNAGRLLVLRSFALEAREHRLFTIDFDLRKSILPPGESDPAYRLVPALRLVEDREAGSLAGSVAAEHLTDTCRPAVYVYAGRDVVPDDVGSSREPLNSSRVLFDGPSGSFRYRVGLLPAGNYTAALTCAAQADRPDTNDDVAFGPRQNVTVRAGAVTEADF